MQTPENISRVDVSDFQQAHLDKQNIRWSEREKILSQIDIHLATGISLQRLSLETGISPPDLNKILKRETIGNAWQGTEDEDIHAMAVLTEWISIASGAPLKNEFADTQTLQELRHLFKHAHKNKRLFAITGGVGIGKSEAAKAYVKSCPRGYRQPGAVRIEFTQSDSKPAAALAKILGALRGEAGHAYRNGNLHDAIGAELNPGDCLILDECNYLNEGLDVVRSIHDDFGVAIVMIGNPEFKETVWGKKSRYAALASRTDRFEFPISKAEDIEIYLDWKGVLTGINTANRKKLIEKAVFLGTRPGQIGGLRALARGLDLCASVYGGIALDGGLLEQVINQRTGAA
jgi:DNA transposition AAA+ family ATPase